MELSEIAPTDRDSIYLCAPELSPSHHEFQEPRPEAMSACNSNTRMLYFFKQKKQITKNRHFGKENNPRGEMTGTNLFLELFLQPVGSLISKCSSAADCLPLKNRAKSKSLSILGSRPMHRVVFTVMLGLLVIGLSGTTSSAGSFSTELSQLAWFWKPPSDGNLDTLAKNFDFFILSHGDEKARDSLKGKGVDEPFLMYMRFEAIQEKSCSDSPHRNQAAYKKGDWCNINKYHSDWFLKDKYGSRIRVDGYYMMDPGNSGWRSFWLSRTKEAMQNYRWDGVMMDNLDASFGRFKKLGKYPAKYGSESSYISAVKGMLSYIYSGINSTGRPLMANVTHVGNADVWFSYMSYLNGGMAEGIIVDWSSGWRSVSDWEENVRRIEKTQSMGRRIVVVAQGSKENYSRQTFAYASFLLAANGKAAFRYGKANYYRYAWLYSNYNIDLGTPLGARYYKDGWWRRDFSKGYVAVNPSSHSAKISGGSTSSSGDDSGGSTSGSAVIKKEAESGSLYSPMKKLSSSSASSGYYISAPTGSGDYRGKAEYSISLPSSGTYYIWGRMIAPNYESNSFQVQWDSGSTYTWSFNPSSSWTWRKFSHSYSLSGGTRKLTIKSREQGTRLDRLIVTNDPNYKP